MSNPSAGTCSLREVRGEFYRLTPTVDGWKKSGYITSGYVDSRIIYTVLYIPGGCLRDFFPSTVWGNKNLGLINCASSFLFGNVDTV